MSQGIHFISNNIPGYGSSDGRSLPYSGVSGKAASVRSYACCSDYNPFRHVKILTMRSRFNTSKRVSLTCTANRRNPDFSRQNKHGFSRNRNRQNQERDNSENLEESELLSSKNGPLLSLSNSPKFQATATPGPREKEIVELFRKVQAQLRERAAIKEEKQIEASQGKGKESETVDSLLKLLRKHSSEQGKRRHSSGSRGFIMDQPEQKSSYNEEQNTSFFDSNSIIREETREPKETQEPNSQSFMRPASNFWRKSPVPRVKYQPIYSTEESSSSILPSKSQGKRKTRVVEPEPEPEPEPESEPEVELVFSDEHEGVFDEISESESSDIDEAYNEEVVEEPSSTESIDLKKLKLSELRVVAKTRGIKGYSKLKKGDLIALLSGDLL